MENNGRGIFYGVIGVATLVVAIIGATFAYFSAAGTAAGASATGATVGIKLSDYTGRIRPNLIPVKVTGKETDFAATANGDCLDKNDEYTVCSVYQYTVENTTDKETGGIAQTFYATISSSENTTFMTDSQLEGYVFAEGESGPKTHNFNIAIFRGTTIGNVNGAVVPATSASDGDLVYRNKVTGPSETLQQNVTNGDLTITLDPTDKKNTDDDVEVSSHTYTMVMWIEETDGNQDYDQGKVFTGSINYATAGGGKLTGAIAATAG